MTLLGWWLIDPQLIPFFRPLTYRNHNGIPACLLDFNLQSYPIMRRSLNLTFFKKYLWHLRDVSFFLFSYLAQA